MHGTVLCVVQSVSNFRAVDKTLVCSHSNESYRAALLFGIVSVHYTVKGGSTFYSVDETLT